MGSYVLYLLMQAFVALIFAYFSATLLFRERKLYMLLVCVGFYLLMGSALLEVWGDKAGWTEWAIGANAALVATGVAAFGAGTLFREASYMERPELAVNAARLFIGIAASMGVILSISGGTSDAIVDPEPVLTAAISGTFSHLGPAGWALGSPLFVGALLMSWLGMRSFMTRQDLKGLWLICGGVLFLLWPFDVWWNDLPLGPAIILLATSVTFFGFQLPKEGEEDMEDNGKKEDEDGQEEDAQDDDGPAPWVKEVIAAHEAKRTTDASDDEEGQGHETVSEEPPED